MTAWTKGEDGRNPVTRSDTQRRRRRSCWCAIPLTSLLVAAGPQPVVSGRATRSGKLVRGEERAEVYSWTGTDELGEQESQWCVCVRA